ncbi:hypothetical protein VaNZ11_011733, partial [Volvox africanus]
MQLQADLGMHHNDGMRGQDNHTNMAVAYNHAQQLDAAGLDAMGAAALEMHPVHALDQHAQVVISHATQAAMDHVTALEHAQAAIQQAQAALEHVQAIGLKHHAHLVDEAALSASAIVAHLDQQKLLDAQHAHLA